ncbi:histidyl-tRNA synthetase [Thermotomaculum hydrothermale]|uniref:Histidine--tRNA ligase n=1 Tax=Thermotomaculum hydrothermale TaxID=981385 RepID=A0A7R6Q0A4_9BACT|nr:histidine--tRNA ligase [Thermotomaculum hydrothermale]BBB33133.1 histidyl-tRNA synthetase [Thermotomaculum hydrothermale]
MPVKTVKGTRDIFYPDIEKWRFFEEKAREILKTYNFKEIMTPIFEYTEVFARGIGEDTDIVHKEMYTFKDRKGRSITLRPENTASVVRAYLEHKMYAEGGIKRLFYIGPMFRYERPQKGRYRQFFQLGVEVFGSKNPYIDAETIELVINLLEKVGLKGLSVKINSLGCEKCRPVYRENLKKFLESVKENLCEDCKRRVDTNPLRVLDCKVPSCKETVKDAPDIQQSLCEDCQKHQDRVFHFLEKMNVKFELDPNLVRGLDYYTRTVFEVVSENLGSQNAILGGGRYDNLVKELGGPDTPAFGWALGIDRLVLLLDNKNFDFSNKTIYVIPAGDSIDYCFSVAKNLRENELAAEVVADSKSLKKALNYVNKQQGRFAIIAGENEAEKNMVVFKNLENRSQKEISFENLVKEIKDEINK